MQFTGERMTILPPADHVPYDCGDRRSKNQASCGVMAMHDQIDTATQSSQETDRPAYHAHHGIRCVSLTFSIGEFDH
jgi:hypothetical protein